jgi:substrate import-associated zinc metallohydrolase lipoprotein
MKNRIKIISVIAFVFGIFSCTRDNVTLGPSVLNTAQPIKTDLDRWIEANYVNPYNIEVLYKWEKNAVDNNRYLYPPTQSQVTPALEIIQRIWINSYNEVGGVNFVKKIAPRQLVLVGGLNLNTNGTILLGLAEAGQRISLFNTDLVDKTDRANVTEFIHTIQHEYIHILNQTKPFDEKNFAKITPAGYTANWYATPTSVARSQGFITDYSRSNVIEDFAEMASTMLTSSKAEYDAIILALPSDKARADVKAKEALVIKYFKEAFDMDFYKLRDVTEKNTNAVINGL